MEDFKVGDVVRVREDLFDSQYRGKVVKLQEKAFLDTWTVAYVGEQGKKPFLAHIDNLRRIPVPKAGDRVRVRTLLGVNGNREGTVVGRGTSETIMVELDGDISDCYFQPYQLEITDSAPENVEAPVGEAVNALYRELTEEVKRMNDVAADMLDYGMKETSQKLANEAETLLRFRNKLGWALKSDGIHNGEDK